MIRQSLERFCQCPEKLREPALIDHGMNSICERCCSLIRPASDLYYLQTRGHVGNSYLWWKEGKHGYTIDIQQAHVFTKEEAYGQAKVRPTEDFPWRKDYIDAHVEFHVNSEKVSRQDPNAV